MPFNRVTDEGVWKVSGQEIGSTGLFGACRCVQAAFAIAFQWYDVEGESLGIQSETAISIW